MPLGWLRVERFRCLREAELSLDPGINLFIGPNAAGKTSLLEAVFFLGRGRSFRTRRRDALIQHGEQDFLIAGRNVVGDDSCPLGVRAGRGVTELRVGGSPVRSIAELAERFSVQVIDPELHKLLEEGPARRRRFIDWGVFHVERRFLEYWQRYHAALRQRNAGLKQGLDDRSIAVWDPELVESGEWLAEQRARYLGSLAAPLRELGAELLGAEVSVAYSPGWSRERPLREELAAAMTGDRRYRATQMGPHRADFSIRIGGRGARGLVSRGQQKLLAGTLLLAQLKLQVEQRPGRAALLLDDPAAELDSANLDRLIAVVRRMPVQLWVTSLTGKIGGLPDPGRVFHVEQGRIIAG